MNRRRPVLFAALTALFAVAYISAIVKGPQLYTDYMSWKVGSRVVMITFPGGGGGTGFHVQAKSGETFLITNSHICDRSTDGQLNVQHPDNNQRAIPRRILENSATTDLCLVEPLPGIVGLRLGSSLTVGQLVQSYGHPGLRPLTQAKGSVVSREKIEILYDWINSDADRAACSKPKNKIEMVQTIFGIGEACLLVIDAVDTTVRTFPGSSGSPLVNEAGNVVGVIFASSNSTNNGCAVPLDALKQFLSQY